ncbi:MAG: DUF4157 domain-containing protein [Litorilinea sp.]
MKSANRSQKDQTPKRGTLMRAPALKSATQPFSTGMEIAPSWQQIATNPTSLQPQDVRTLQARAGNQAVQRLLAQHTTSSPAQENSADAVAQQMVNAPVLQRAPSADPLDAPSKIAKNHAAHNMASTNPITKPGLQRKPANAGIGGVAGGDAVAPEIEQAIQRAPGGAPLQKNLRDRMGNGIGQDFSQVRVHTDAQADTLARSLQARAFTTGSDIFFKQGEYNPASQSGQHLMAHELTHVAQQAGSQPTVQRKSDKLPTKADMRNLAKSGFKLFGTSLYGKILNAVDEYHTGIPNTDFRAQLNQLLTIHNLMTQWQVSHGIADTNTGSKNKAEGNRRDVLATLRTEHLPKETADVYQQAKTANVAMDVHMLMALMDIVAGNPGVGAAIEQDYASALHGYTASTGDVTQAENLLEGPKSKLFDMAGTGLDSAVNSLRGLSDDPSDGRMSEDIMDAPINPHDSDTLKKIKKERLKLRTLVPSLQNISNVEMKSIGSYTDESGYREMNAMLRGSSGLMQGNNKSSRKNSVDLRKEVAVSMLMATSALNRLPDWDGSTVYRGENIGWAGGAIQNGANITLKSFTSTSANRAVPLGFAGSGPDSAFWEIDGVTTQGKDIAKLSVQAKGDYLGINGGGATEDEVLLRPYTTLHIDSITDNHGQGSFKWLIRAHAV